VPPKEEDAIAVTHPHVVEHAGKFVRLDIREESGAFAHYVAQSGLAVFDTVPIISLGGRWMPSQDEEQVFRSRTWALASQAFG